jgi:hypothetical protein
MVLFGIITVCFEASMLLFRTMNALFFRHSIQETDSPRAIGNSRDES